MSAKLKIYFDNGLKGYENWGCQGNLDGSLKVVREYLEVIIERIKKDEKQNGRNKD